MPKALSRSCSVVSYDNRLTNNVQNGSPLTWGSDAGSSTQTELAPFTRNSEISHTIFKAVSERFLIPRLFHSPSLLFELFCCVCRDVVLVMAVELGEEMCQTRDDGGFAGFGGRVVGMEVTEGRTGSKEIEKLGREFV